MKKIYLILVLILIAGLVKAEDINESAELINESQELLSASVNNGRMILYPILNPGETTIMEKSLGVTNQNDFDVNVSLEAWGDIKDITEFKENVIFPLGPFEEKNINFTLNVSEMKLYEGEIKIRFLKGSFGASNENEVGGGLGIISQVIISPQFNENISTDIEDYNGGKDDYGWLIYLGIGFVILIIIIISWGVIKNVEGKP